MLVSNNLLNPELWLLLSFCSQVLKEFKRQIFSTFPKTKIGGFWIERFNKCICF
jgi:hypothetical protein